MGTESGERPRVTRGARGNVVSIADLPPAGTKRWVASRKEIVVDAVRGGIITLEEVKARYLITDDEYRSWSDAYQMVGPDAKSPLRLAELLKTSKRAYSPSKRRLFWDTFTLDIDRRVMVNGDKVVGLTTREIILCRELFSSEIKSKTHEQLFEALGIEKGERGYHNLHSAVQALRKKMKAAGMPKLNIVSRRGGFFLLVENNG
jgi:hypothetical protein